MKHQTGLMDHLVATRETFRERTGKDPTRFALGRWDARELAHLAAPYHRGATARSLFSCACAGDGEIRIMEVPVKLDPRIGRMPGAWWWT